jgi:hypothetical protein
MLEFVLDVFILVSFESDIFVHFILIMGRSQYNNMAINTASGIFPSRTDAELKPYP